MSSLANKLQAINVFTELDNLGLSYESVGSGYEIKVKCPNPDHEDDTPSCSLNTDKKVWKCHSCNEAGDLIYFLALYHKTTRAVIYNDLSRRYKLKDLKVISPEVVEKYHSQINKAGQLLEDLKTKGITKEIIRKARIGFNGKRITIPVYDEQGNVVNVRKYIPNAKEKKFESHPGFGSARLYPIEQCRYETLWLCAGEIKALVAAEYLNSIEIGAICVTGGEGTWKKEFSPKIKDKTIYICMDIDSAGVVASKKLAHILYRVCKEVRIINLSLDKEKYPKGDLNNYLCDESQGIEGLQQCMEEAFLYSSNEGDANELLEDTFTEIDLYDCTNPRYVNQGIKFTASVSHLDPTPFLLPKELKVRCGLDQKNCAVCPIYAEAKLDAKEEVCEVKIEIPKKERNLLNLINSPDKIQRQVFCDYIGIPPCKSVVFSITDYYKATEVCLAPTLSLGNSSNSSEVQPAIILDREIDLGSSYEMQGVLYSRPTNQKAIILSGDIEEAEDSLDSFSPLEEELKELELFQPLEKSVEALREKLAAIYDDLAYNVTKIFGRPEVHLLVDLVYHSPLLIEFDGEQKPGWISALLIGDSSQGKSKVSSSLLEYYGIGERVDCKSASVAGIIGGLQQQDSKKWYVHWGIVPMHDRRLVILEEVKGAPKEVIQRLTDSRSTGIIEIPKIERRRAHARTRLLFISNPRSDKGISGFSYGVEAIHELISSPEDIRRLDIAAIVSIDDLPGDISTLPFEDRTYVEHKYKAELCRRLILFAWSRKSNNVIFTQEASKAIFESGQNLCEKYVEAYIPLVSKNTIAEKLARLSASIACRMFSVDSDYNILVEDYHVKYTEQFMDKLYSSDAFGYHAFSEALRQIETIKEPGFIASCLNNGQGHGDLIKGLLRLESITVNDVMDWGSMTLDASQRLISTLVRNACVYRDGREYKKTSAFISLLKKIRNNEIAEKPILDGDEF